MWYNTLASEHNRAQGSIGPGTVKRNRQQVGKLLSPRVRQPSTPISNVRGSAKAHLHTLRGYERWLTKSFLARTVDSRSRSPKASRSSSTRKVSRSQSAAGLAGIRERPRNPPVEAIPTAATETDTKIGVSLNTTGHDEKIRVPLFVITAYLIF
jgi:hypothetical protein